MPIANSFPRGGMDNTLIGDLQAVDRYNMPEVSYDTCIFRASNTASYSLSTTYESYKAFDRDTATYWRSDEAYYTRNLSITFDDTPIIIKEIQVLPNTACSKVTVNITPVGETTATQLTEITTMGSTITCAFENNTIKCNRLTLVCAAVDSSTYATINECQITKWEKDGVVYEGTFIPKMTSNSMCFYDVYWDLNIPLTEYKTGKKITLQPNGLSLPYKDTDITANIIPTFTSNEDVEGWHISATNEYSSSYGVWKAFDNSDTTYWQGITPSNTTTIYEVVIEVPEGLSIINPRIDHSVAYWYGTSNSMFWVYGFSKKTSAWVMLGTRTISSGSQNSSQFVVTDGQEYTKFRLQAPGSSTSYPPKCYYFKINGGILRDYNQTSVLEDFSTVREIKLNINGLGYKVVNSGNLMKVGSSYDLCYNGDSWDICQPFVVNTYTGSGGTTNQTGYSQTINLGFTPSMIFVGKRNAWFLQGYGGIAFKGIPVKGSHGSSSSNIIEIVENGIKVYSYYHTSDTHTCHCNDSGAIYDYIAFR